MDLTGPIGIAALLALLLVILGLWLYNRSRKRISRQKERPSTRSATYLSISGWDSVTGPFNYRSFDDGQNWYHVEENGECVRTVDEAGMDKVRAAVEALRAAEGLMAQIAELGLLDTRDPRAAWFHTGTGFKITSNE